MEVILNKLQLPTDKNIRYLLVILVGILLAMGFLASPSFFSFNNLQSMSSQMPLLGLLALAMAVCMLTGGINLSIIATTNACGLVMASIITQAPDSAAMLVIALAGGVATAVMIGLFNGGVNCLCWCFSHFGNTRNDDIDQWAKCSYFWGKRDLWVPEYIVGSGKWGIFRYSHASYFVCCLCDRALGSTRAYPLRTNYLFNGVE